MNPTGMPSGRVAVSDDVQHLTTTRADRITLCDGLRAHLKNLRCASELSFLDDQSVARFRAEIARTERLLAQLDE